MEAIEVTDLIIFCVEKICNIGLFTVRIVNIKLYRLLFKFRHYLYLFCVFAQFILYFLGKILINGNSACLNKYGISLIPVLLEGSFLVFLIKLIVLLYVQINTLQLHTVFCVLFRVQGNRLYNLICICIKSRNLGSVACHHFYLRIIAEVLSAVGKRYYLKFTVFVSIVILVSIKILSVMYIKGVLSPVIFQRISKLHHRIITSGALCFSFHLEVIVSAFFYIKRIVCPVMLTADQFCAAITAVVAKAAGAAELKARLKAAVAVTAYHYMTFY